MEILECYFGQGFLSLLTQNKQVSTTTLTLRETITSEQTLTLQLPSESLFLDSIQHHPPQIYMLLCAQRTTLLNIIKITNTFFFLFKI